MFKFLKYLVIIVIIFFVFINYKYYSAIDNSVSDVVSNQNFIVATGENVKQISENLYKQKLIESKFYFEVYVWRNNLDSKLQAGQYILSPSLSTRQIIDALATGKTINKEKEIKTLEGWTTKDISQYFETEDMFQPEELLELVGYPRVDYRYNKQVPQPKDYSSQFDFLKDKPGYVGLEGYLFPDTYRIFKDASLEDVILKMLSNFDQKLTSDMRRDIKKQGKTIYEIVTMASVIEKEVRSEKDMKIVSGLFWNRIKNGQALESCATLAYILGVNKPQYTIEDTKIESPYNSYRNQGLPPGPVSNPGIQAIRAAIYPTETNYNYFLSRPDTGETVFSATYQGHLNNKNKYLD